MEGYGTMHAMKTRSRTHTVRQFLIVLAVVVGLVACTPRESVVIYITPTAATGSTTQEVAAIPTIAWTPSATSNTPLTESPTDLPFIMPTPIVSIGVVPTQAPGIATAAPTSTNTPENVTLGAPTATFGAIIGTDYTLPPTNTPPPAATNTPVNTPIATPYTVWPKLDGSEIGIQLDYNVQLDYWYTLTGLTKDRNVGWVKMQANWSALQPNGPDEYSEHFQVFTDYVQRAHGRGLKVLLSVAKAPEWARSTTEEYGPPTDPATYANFLRFMIAQIKPENIDAIEIWNEPNLIREWRGALPFNGAGYMQVFRPAYDAIKQTAPHIQVVSAGLAPTGDSEFSIDDRTYLQQMYDAGLGQYSDVVIGVHPYGWGNPPDFRCCNTIDGRGWDDNPHFFFLDNLDAYREIMVQNGHENVQMWVTEFGWATWADYPVEFPTGDDWMTYTSPEEQAQYVIRAFEIGQSLDYVGPMFLWNLNFGGNTPIMNRSEMAAYSLIYDAGQGLRYRPLYDLLQEVVVPTPTLSPQ
jgi:polysaccharide biosynthesis protein PslG